MATTDEQVAGARSRKGARTRARLVEAAKGVFAEQGLLDARITDITAAAGVSYGAFYHYFDSKESLFREVADEVAARLAAPMDEVILQRGSPTTPQERLREGIRRHFESYREEARLLGVIEQAARVDHDFRRSSEERRGVNSRQVADSIRRLQERGLADSRLDAAVAAVALGAMTSGFAELWLAEGQIEADFEAAVDTVTRLFVNALGLAPLG